jgi:hypothetical protein
MFVYKSSLKMAASHFNCTAVEQGAVICFLWSEGFGTSEVYRRMRAHCGEHCMARKNLYKWVDIFKCERSTLDGEE